MTKITVDAALGAKLVSADDWLEICDPAGETLGYFQPVRPRGRLKELSPFSDREIEERRKNRSGRPLDDILKDLEQE